MHQRRYYLPALILCLMLGAGCAGSKKEKEPDNNQTAEILYNEGMDLLEQKRHKPAAETFERLQKEYPYSRWAIRAEIMAAYAYYKQGAYDDALLAIERFLKLHPGNENAAYAYYLRALCYYEQIADIQRDQQLTESAKSALKELIARFPQSTYARDARLKLDLVNDHLAGKEMEIGRFYLKEGNLTGAINRFRTVIDEYQTTSHVAEALYRLCESYLALGVVEEAKKYASVLGYNFPGSKWYKYSYRLLKQDMPPTLPQAERQAEDHSFYYHALKKFSVHQ